MTLLRDLRSDWRRWSRTERMVSLAALTAAGIVVLPYLLVEFRAYDTHLRAAETRHSS